MSFFSNSENIIATNNNLTAVQGDQIINPIYNYNYYTDPSSSASAQARSLAATNDLKPGSTTVTEVLKSKISSLFLGRKSELDKLKAHFPTRRKGEQHTRRSLLLYGMGGIGKTQICLKFAEENAKQFSRIFFIDASTTETITLSLKAIYDNTPAIHSSGIVDGSTSSILAWISKLDEREDWLAVYDNAEDHVRKYIPSGDRGNILMTSRNRSIGRYMSFNTMEIDKMEEDDAVSLLLKSACLDQAVLSGNPSSGPLSESPQTLREMAKKITAELHCHPLAVDQAGASIESGMCHINKYLELYSQHRKELLDDSLFARSSDYERTVYGTLDLSFKEIESNAKAQHHSGAKTNAVDTVAAQSAISILQLFAFFHHDNIDEDIFKLAALGYNTYDAPHDFFKPPHLSSENYTLLKLDFNGSWDELRFRKGIRMLLSFSLIKENTSGNCYSIHPLIHSWSRDRLSLDQQQKICADAKTMLLSSISFQNTVENHKHCQKLIPHISAIQHYIELIKLQTEYNDYLSERLAFAYNKAGMWEMAEDVFSMILFKRKGLFGKKNLYTLKIMTNLGEIYKYQARWTEAEIIILQIFELSQAVLGAENSIALESMDNLAEVYQSQGQWKKAEKMNQKLIEIKNKLFGEKNLNTLRSLDNLGVVYRNQGKWKQAAKIMEEVVKIRGDVLGKEHPDTFSSLNNLAMIYQDQGLWKEAEDIYIKQLNIETQFLSKTEHPHILTSLNNWSVLYKDQGKWKEAEMINDYVLQTRIKVLGDEHPDTLISSDNMATLLKKQGKFQEAKKIRKKVLELREQHLGKEHPDTISSMNNLLILYKDEGKWKEAEEISNKAVQLSTQILGKEHPSTLASLSNLAEIYHNQGRLKEAESISTKILHLRIQVLGEEHPQTLISLHNLASIYSDQGRWKEAEQLYIKKIDDSHNKNLERHHPDTLTSMSNLVTIYNNQGKWKDAKKLNMQVLSLRTVILGKEHPDTLISMNTLAMIYFEQGRLKEALNLNKDLVSLRTKVLGEEHPFTLTSMSNLAILYADQKNWKDAEEWNVKVIKLRSKVLGESHQDTLASMNDLLLVYKNQRQREKTKELEAQIQARL